MRTLILSFSLLCMVCPALDAQTLRSERLFPQEARRTSEIATEMRDRQRIPRDMSTMEARNREITFQAVVAQNLADQGKEKGVLILVPTVPVTFNALEKDSVGEWRMGAAMTAGAGATFILGKATFNGETTTVHPWLIGGAAINAGLKEQADRRVTEAVNVSGFFGFGNAAISFSRDILHGTTSIGLSLKLDVLTNMAPDAFLCIAGCKPPRNQINQ